MGLIFVRIYCLKNMYSTDAPSFNSLVVSIVVKLDAFASRPVRERLLFELTILVILSIAYSERTIDCMVRMRSLYSFV